MKDVVAQWLKRGLSLAAVLWLAGCGWAEWPASSGARSDSRFIGASAVRVGKGDSVWAIAKRHRVSQRDLIEANNLRPPYVLQVGQRLVLPRPKVHIVKRGDTLFGIGNRYRTDPYGIARANGLKRPYTIHVGQKLNIPQSTEIRTARASTTKNTVQSTPTVKKPAIPDPPKRSGGTFSWPVRGKIISSFGAKKGGLQNDGINIAVRNNEAVKAAENGVVAYAGNELRGFGNLLLIKHANGWITAYAHNNALLVKRGDKVKRGQMIAKAGNTGSVKTPQVHFEVRKGKQPVDPIKYLRG